MAQATAPQISSPNVPVPGKILSTPISRQSVSSGRTFNINTSGLVGYKRIGTPIPASLPTTPSQIILPRQQGNIDSMSAPSSRSNLITGKVSISIIYYYIVHVIAKDSAISMEKGLK